MKALSLTQPWATLVAIGAKHLETRSWATDYRGPLVIHAAKTYPGWARQLCLEEPFLSALRAAGILQYGVWHKTNNQLPLGAVVAICDLVDVVRISPANQPAEPELSFGDFTPGRYAWRLANVRQLAEPVLATGHLGLWTFAAWPELISSLPPGERGMTVNVSPAPRGCAPTS